MFVIFRSSTLIRSNRRARSVLAFSAQSLRRSVSRALSRARASRTRPRRFEPRRPRASLRSSRRMRARSAAVRPGTHSNSPSRQGRGHRHASVNTHDLAVARCGNRVGDHGEGDVPPPGAVHGDPVGSGARRRRAGPAEPHPAGLRHPDLAGLPAQPPHVPLPPALPDDAEPLVAADLAPGRTPGRVARVEERGHRGGEVPERLLLDHLAARGQPRVLGPGLGELPALFQVARRAQPARPPVLVLLDGQVPHVPGVAAVAAQHGLLGGGREQPVPGHANTLSTTTDICGEVKRRSSPA